MTYMAPLDDTFSPIDYYKIKLRGRMRIGVQQERKRLERLGERRFYEVQRITFTRYLSLTTHSHFGVLHRHAQKVVQLKGIILIFPQVIFQVKCLSLKDFLEVP